MLSSSKFRFLALLFSAILALSACGSSDASASPTDADEAEELADTDAQDDVNDEAPETTAAPETTTAAPETTTTTEAPETTTTEAPVVAVDGAALYESNCSRCHQSDGSGARGPNIQGRTATAPIETIVVNGRGAMPSFPNLSGAEVSAIANHVVTAF